MSSKKLSAVLLLCGSASIAQADDAAEQSRERFVCSVGEAQRLIDIYREDRVEGRPDFCRVDYTRGGVTRQMWSARGDYAYCVKQALALVTKLSIGANFACKPQSLEPQPTESR